MSESHRLAMEAALTLHKGTGISASDLVGTAEMIRLYCEGSLKIPGLAIDDNRQGRRLPVNDSNGLSVKGGDVGSVHNARGVSVGVLKSTGDTLDKPFSGVISSHNNSSSVQDGESVGELPTPSRTETVAASGDTEEAARTHGGAA